MIHHSMPYHTMFIYLALSMQWGLSHSPEQLQSNKLENLKKMNKIS